MSDRLRNTGNRSAEQDTIMNHSADRRNPGQLLQVEFVIDSFGSRFIVTIEQVAA